MKITDERIDKILELIAGGYTREAACYATNVGRTSFYAWLRKGKMDNATNIESLEGKLADGVPTSESRYEQDLLNKIHKVTDQHWIAAAWILERRWPERYAKRVAEPVFEANDTIRVIG